MDKKQKKEIEALKAQAEKFDIQLKKSHIVQIEAYLKALHHWNRKINLTALKKDKDILIKHILDSLVCLPLLKDVRLLVDIGTGAGFPGLPIKILRPDIGLYLVEARRKRASFLRYVINGLQQSGTEVFWSRVEEEGLLKRFKADLVDAVITRAALPEESILKVGAEVLPEKGKILLMKGEINKEEEMMLEGKAKQYGKQVIEIYPYRLPETERDRNIVVIQ